MTPIMECDNAADRFRISWLSSLSHPIVAGSVLQFRSCRRIATREGYKRARRQHNVIAAFAAELQKLLIRFVASYWCYAS